MFADLVRKCRSIRRFKQNESISRETLLELVDLGRLSASGSNQQPLKYWLSADPETNEKLFTALAWAGYLKDWPGPEEGERPAAYIVMLGDTEIKNAFDIDLGIAGQTIALAAAEKGIGTCMMSLLKRDIIREALGIPERYEILMVLAHGYPAEEVVLEEAGEDGDIKYWRDEKGVHHVPKRPLDEVVLG